MGTTFLCLTSGLKFNRTFPVPSAFTGAKRKKFIESMKAQLKQLGIPESKWNQRTGEIDAFAPGYEVAHARHLHPKLKKLIGEMVGEKPPSATEVMKELAKI